MATDGGQNHQSDSDPHTVLHNDTAVNVAGLLKSQIGATRSYQLRLDTFEADGELIARQVEGDVRLTRLRDGVLAHLTVSGLAPLVCVRCLREYDQPFETAFDEEYRQTVDVRTGAGLGAEPADDEQVSLIDENHELDLGEPLRQEILISLPMRPDCGPDCPGPDQVASDGDQADEAVDERLAALASLLGDEAARD